MHILVSVCARSLSFPGRKNPVLVESDRTVHGSVLCVDFPLYATTRLSSLEMSLSYEYYDLKFELIFLHLTKNMHYDNYVTHATLNKWKITSPAMLTDANINHALHTIDLKLKALECIKISNER